MLKLQYALLASLCCVAPLALRRVRGEIAGRHHAIGQSTSRPSPWPSETPRQAIGDFSDSS